MILYRKEISAFAGNQTPLVHPTAISFHWWDQLRAAPISDRLVGNLRIVHAAVLMNNVMCSCQSA
jgi:hypothetical protein